MCRPGGFSEGYAMKNILTSLLALSLHPAAQAVEPLVLGNAAWPPFILEGGEEGTAERLVCGALERAGWPCTVQTSDWEAVLDEARIGAIDGIAATWESPDLQNYLMFSEPYLTIRIVPVTSDRKPDAIQSVADLEGRRVAMVTGYAYGDEITAIAKKFETVQSKDSLSAMESVRDGAADVALLDLLVARAALDDSLVSGVILSNVVLATADLHFAVSRQNPDAAQIMGDFQRSFRAMLTDGTVNEILDIDWLATDFGHLGQTDLVLRSGANLDKLAHPSEEGSVYSLGSSDYQYEPQSTEDASRVNYQVEGKSHSSLQSALNSVFGTEIGCEHKEFSSEFDCTDLFKKQ
jgi:ABC-type amino acid transport substrate-binding protein